MTKIQPGFTMNRAKRPFNKAIAKAIRKEVRDGQRSTPSAEQLADQMVALAEIAPARHPKKSAEKEQQVVAGFKKRVALKNKKPRHKISKRTTPGKVEDFAFAPHTTNVEGKHWLQTIQKQTILQAKSFVKKLFKRKSYR